MERAEKYDFQEALNQETPLQIVGVTNACCALLAAKAQFQALYLSGAGVANALGYPDLGMTTFTEVRDEIQKITERVDLPILVDGDTGFGSALTIQRMVKEFIRAGACAVHIEDQVFPKRCGHVPKKELVRQQEMGDRIKAALDARSTPHFWIIARTDAIAPEGLKFALERALYYQELGADAIFVEAATELKHYATFSKSLSIPVLANITEFGQTPLFSVEDLKQNGVQMVLYPLSAFRAMNKAAELVYQTIRKKGSQASVISMMQTREELYKLLHYDEFDSLLEKE